MTLILAASLVQPLTVAAADDIQVQVTHSYDRDGTLQVDQTIQPGKTDMTDWIRNVNEQTGKTYELVRVVLEKTPIDYEYTVRYYSDAVEPANKLGEDVPLTARYGERIVLDKEALNLRKPDRFAADGVQQQIPTITTNGVVIDVVYPRLQYQYIIEYYKDSVETGELLHTTEPVTVGAGTTVELTSEQLSAFRPSGPLYDYGTQVGGPVAITQDGQVIKVLYVKEQGQFNYIIEYYKDEIDSVGGSNYLGSDATNVVNAGTQVTLTTAQLDAKRPLQHYGPGVQQGNQPAEITQNDQIIQVVYPKLKYNYIVEYYQGNLDDSSKIYAASPIQVDALTNVTLTSDQLNLKKPASGYQDGIQQGGAPTQITEDNQVIKVLYPPEDKDETTLKILYLGNNNGVITEIRRLSFTDDQLGETFDLGQPGLLDTFDFYFFTGQFRFNDADGPIIVYDQSTRYVHLVQGEENIIYLLYQRIIQRSDPIDQQSDSSNQHSDLSSAKFINLEYHSTNVQKNQSAPVESQVTSDTIRTVLNDMVYDFEPGYVYKLYFEYKPVDKSVSKSVDKPIQTGDSGQNVYYLAAILLISGGVVTALLLNRRRKGH